MSVLRLLATGKSLIGMKDTSSPYRMRTANLLPKFESTKNPFAPKAEVTANFPAAPLKTESVKAELARLETAALFDAQLQPVAAPVPAKESKPVLIQPIALQVESKPIIAMAAAPVAKPISQQPAIRAVAATVAPEPVAKRESLFARVKKVNLLAYLPMRESKSSRAKSKFERTPVQAELSLEKVKVIRNDLNETDLEVITAKPSGTPVLSGPRLQPTVRTEAKTISRLTARFFGAGETQVR